LAKLRALALVVLLAASFQVTAAQADSNLFVGVGEDNLIGRPAATVAIARDLGIRAFRLSLMWEPGQTELDPTVRMGLSNAAAAASGARIVLAVYGERGVPPLGPTERDQFCGYIRNVLEQVPQINDVVIWNEPNLTYYWRPQFNGDGTSAAPAAYHDLLARCWDVLHAFRPSVNLVGPVVSLWGNDNPDAMSNISHSPLNFIKKLGEAYRASGRARPIIDTFGHHPHPHSASERPWKRHDSSVYVSIGDWGKLMNALAEAFEGTPQPLPGEGPSIWWLEVGYQTLIDFDKTHLYSPEENWRGPLPDFVGGEPDWPPPSTDSPAPDQATQLVDSVRISYCQPYVEAFFNFLLWDEPALTRWQSGVLWFDGTRKGSYDSFKKVIAEVNERRVDCSRMKGGGPFIQPVTGAPGRLVAAPAIAGRVLGTTAGYWNEWDLVVRPGTTSLPSGFFAEATPSAIQYTGTRTGPFGFVMLRGRLLADGQPVADKALRFVAGGASYSATTDRNGVATVAASLPVPVGNWDVQVTFAGDPQIRPASTQAELDVFNTPARVASAGTLRAGPRATGFFRVSYDGKKLRGRVRFRGGVDLRSRRFTALGVGKRGRAAWFTGFDRNGKRFWAYAEDNTRRGKRDRFRLWVGAPARVAAAKLRSGNVEITTRRKPAARKRDVWRKAEFPRRR
jgi:hypothetical protein